MVLVGLVIAWRLAGSPTLRSPPSTNPTTDGVVRFPSAFAITIGSFPSITATHELVVPRSIPIILDIVVIFLILLFQVYALPSSFIATAFVLLMTKNVPKEKVCHFVIFGRLY